MASTIQKTEEAAEAPGEKVNRVLHLLPPYRARASDE